jgi:hypothetical protein
MGKEREADVIKQEKTGKVEGDTFLGQSEACALVVERAHLPVLPRLNG